MWRRVSVLLCLPERRAAKATFVSKYPHLRYNRARVRKREADRVVLALFYDNTEIPQRPTPYKFFAVTKETLETTELPLNPESPCRINGYK